MNMINKNTTGNNTTLAVIHTHSKHVWILCYTVYIEAVLQLTPKALLCQ